VKFKEKYLHNLRYKPGEGCWPSPNLLAMENKNNLEAVPAQYTGSEMDVIERRNCSTLAEAEVVFERACTRLLSVNEWGRYAGISAFQLIDPQGIRAERQAQLNDYIRIDIPGPGTQAGMGYDWVQIEEITTESHGKKQTLSMRVRPCAHPLSRKKETAHFLKSEATSSFVIIRSGRCVSAEEHARNEVPNTDNGSLYDKGRNFMVGMAAKLGFSYPQWKGLVKALLQD
jgi:hypothetical protein